MIWVTVRTGLGTTDVSVTSLDRDDRFA